MWLLVPIDINNPGDEWLGTIQRSAGESSDWTVNPVRKYKYGDPNDITPFGKARSVGALLDLKDRCTLLLPRVTDTEFSFGSPPKRLGRTSVVIKCHGLLRGMTLGDYNELLAEHRERGEFWCAGRG